MQKRESKEIFNSLLEQGFDYYEIKDILTKAEKIVNSEISKKEKNDLKNTFKENKSLINKCFYSEEYQNVEGVKVNSDPKFEEVGWPTEKRFYKIVSNYSIDKDHVTCLIFNEYPGYSYHNNMSDFSLESFKIEQILKESLKDKQEISLEEYNSHAEKHFNELLKLKLKK